MISSEEFMKLSDPEIGVLIRQQGRPKTGIFVPDGNRRMTLALSQENPTSNLFFQKYVKLTTQFFQHSLEVFFSHGLKNLIVPLISPSVLNREQRYQNLSLLEGLRIILKREDWCAFYQKYGIRVFSYGNLARLRARGLADICDWINALKTQTANNRQHNLFLGFLAPVASNDEQTRLIIDFYQKNNRAPSREEQIRAMYGTGVPMADFFIMATKFAGLGALPPLLYNEKTQLYFLAAPGVLALNRDVFRKILYDYLFLRFTGTRATCPEDSLESADRLADYFFLHKESVLGLGKKIGKFWVPMIENEKGK